MDTFGSPTEVQKAAWPAIEAGRHTLVSAPTGTGKTLSAFLVFIDKLGKQARAGQLKEELQLIYVSPLKSLAADIRENLNRPLTGIGGGELDGITTAIRTGDTTQSERRRMVSHPPHILIITPESLYLMLTSKSGQTVLKTAGAVIIDELHALIDTKRGAHLMLSLARLDKLCGKNLQRIGLSATIEPLETAAAYLAPEPAVIAAPVMKKKISIEVAATLPSAGKRRKDPVWEELAQAVYKQCLNSRSVIAFAEARRYAEKLAYFVNRLGGEDFAKVHHGSLSKAQRAEVEEELRSGRLRLLCATSSMELGIDVGDVDQVLQIGCPRTISGTMQRLGRAGHGPGRVSVMYMYPRTVLEALHCGMTAQVALEGGVEHAKPPERCLDVLAQHLVSMAAVSGYTVEDVLPLLSRAYSFKDVTKEEVEAVLRMLAGDYEHAKEIPVRPRILYDRIHGRVEADNYSRMLAVSAGGTIPDKGLYTVKTQEGVKLGELDEEFVYESYIGDRFLLGSFAWKIVSKDKDSVIVTQAPVDGARLPFWKGEAKGRDRKTSLSFGRILRLLGGLAGQEAKNHEKQALTEELEHMGFHESTADSVADLIRRQIAATGCLPDDRTIVMEHFTDQNGCHQIMVHSLFGKRVNTPLSLLVQYAAREISGVNLGCVDDEEGFLLYPYGDDILPERLLYLAGPDTAAEILEAILPVTPVFGITFRYNAARALMMGMRHSGRQPLWMQRLKSTQMLDNVLEDKEHPLVRETIRECLEDLWDVAGVIKVLEDIRAGLIAVREIYVDTPSPMSLPLQWQVEAAEMYQYTPVTQGMREAAYDELRQMDKLKPTAEALAKVQDGKKLPEDEKRLHSFLIMEGDLTAGELDVPVEWLESLAAQGLALYKEPGFWIAAEHEEEYAEWQEGEEPDSAIQAGMHIIRRMLYYRGAKSEKEIAVRYFLSELKVREALHMLLSSGEIVEDRELYYHSKLYDKARKNTIETMRRQAVTCQPEKYASLMARFARINAPSEEQVKQTVERYVNRAFPAALWESVIFPQRVKNYSEAMLDRLLGQGEYYWQLNPDGSLCFKRTEDIDWEQEGKEPLPEWEEGEKLLYQELRKRGASFLQALNKAVPELDNRKVLLKLAERGAVCADSFVPVRQWLAKDKITKASARQRVNVRVKALSAGRWDVIRPSVVRKNEELLEKLLRDSIILCRETFRQSAEAGSGMTGNRDFTWSIALSILRIQEYTGQVRRGYFIEGMSGAQFVRGQDYAAVMAALADREAEIIWLNAADPAQMWGKALGHMEGRSFLNVPGTAVALKEGRPAAVLERQGKVLRVWEEAELSDILEEFVRVFKGRQLFPDLRRLVIKEYPASAAEILKEAGFLKEMQDFVLYK